MRFNMMIKGINSLRKHVPDLNTPFGVLRLLLVPVILFFLVTALLNWLLSFWLNWQLVAEILLGSLGFGFLALFFRNKQNFKDRFGPLAYSRAASLFGLPGVSLITAVVAHIRYLSGPQILPMGGSVVLWILGWAAILVGVLLGLRTVLIFGIDNLVMLYVYFPEESQLVNHKIYTVLRHPAYAALQFIAFGLALLNGGWMALSCAFSFSLGLWGWVRLVEEKELIRRFGPSYSNYRKRVPAFWPRLRELREFFSFLVVGR